MAPNPSRLAGLSRRSRFRAEGFDKQVGLLPENLRHPALRAKKYDQANDIWQARVNRDRRFYFQQQGDTYTIISIIPHPK